MMRASFLSGAALAFLLAFVGSAGFTALTPFFAAGAVLRLLISGLGLIYLLFLMRGRRRRTGLVTILAAYVLLAVACWLTGPVLPLFLLLHVAFIWLVRSFAYYSGVLPALIDLGLSAFATAASAWALTRSTSVFLAVWCFFLVQALFVAIPARMPRRRPDRPASPIDDDTFEQARRRADRAFSQLIARDGR